MSEIQTDETNSGASHSFIFEQTIETLTEIDIAKKYPGRIDFDSRTCSQVFPEDLEVNQGIFSNQSEMLDFPQVFIIQQKEHLVVSCTCDGENGQLCEHEVLVLISILRRDELGCFFNDRLRHEKLKKFAVDYGLENETDLDRFFELKYDNKKLVIVSRLPELIPVNKEVLRSMQETITADSDRTNAVNHPLDGEKISVVLRQHKHYRYLIVELYRSQTTKDGKVKNPVTLVNPMDLIWETEDHHTLKFLTGIHKFQTHSDSKRSKSDLIALRAIVKNPMNYDFYFHDSDISEKVTANALVPIKVRTLLKEVNMTVDKNSAFFEFAGNVEINETVYELKDLPLRFTYFIQVENVLYLVDKLPVLGLMDLLKKKQQNMVVHASKYKEFKSHLLNDLEDQVNIEYKYILPATKQQLKSQQFNQEAEKILYLSDFGGHVMIIPVMRYGEVEIQTRTKRQIYSVDSKGTEFLVKRDDRAETAFTSVLVRQHPYLEEQLENGLHYFYLHKKHFLEEAWFLNTFEQWNEQNITVFGFNELEGNRLNPNKIKVDIKVLSGINWFNTEISVGFGKKKASLKHLHKAIRNKSKYVALDDGTLGILPAEWIEKFAAYFNTSEIIEAGKLLIPKVSFSAVEALFDEEMLDEEVKNELNFFRQKLAGFDSIQEVEVPAELNATLRPYQKQGLNWLNFLDDLNFGGCLADDMGLGKSIQVIAFILSQRKKSSHNTNLIVVPATLIFNWKIEIVKFAPSIKIHTIHGSDRVRNTNGFENVEVVLTSYGTLLSDITYLKDYNFNYIFLDESQNIKNPETARYKAIRMLKSRNKITITGTPIENNTFDLYSQFSFTSPGLLGNKRYFREVYSTPVDQFKNTRRTLELQNKIRPFMLRRTKQEVASDLPDKTEMVLYCEMNPEQRKLYDAYEKEFREYISATTHEELNKNAMNVLRGLTRLRQICDAPALLTDDPRTGNIPSAKIELLVEQIESKAPHHKMLVFSQFVSMLDLIGKELTAKGIPFVTLTGKTRNREALVEQFQNDPEIKVFLISLKAGGTGLNLTQADYVYLVDPWWNPAVENQAIDRSHRIGQHKNVMAVRLICPDTVEEKIRTLQESKKVLADELISTDASFLKSLSKTDLMDLFLYP